MNELSIEVNYGVILFHDKSAVFINQKAYELLVEVYSNPQMQQFDLTRFKKGIYARGSISKILTLQEFYEEYPDKRPDPKQMDQFKKYEGLPDRIPVNGFPSFIRGLARFIQEYEAEGKIAHNSRKLLEHYEKKLIKN